MNILVSNDDGIFALGIRALANALAIAGHTVTVVCPDRERSATGHGLTLHRPLRVDQIENVFEPEVTAWACSGTPSDCVKLALDAILPGPPDFVVSGINQGANLGTDVLYSGTVSAAMEGVLEGIPAVAISLTSFAYRKFAPAADFAVQLLAQLEKDPLGLPVLLNINVPPVPREEIKGVIVARQGVRRYFDQFEKRVDPRGKTYYWLAGEVMEEGEAELPSMQLSGHNRPGTNPSATEAEQQLLKAKFDPDVRAIKANYITVTPLQYNLTAYATLNFLEEWLNDAVSKS